MVDTSKKKEKEGERGLGESTGSLNLRQLKKWPLMGTNVSRIYMLSRVKRDQKQKNRLGNSFSTIISYFLIEIGISGGFEVRYSHLYLVVAPK